MWIYVLYMGIALALDPFRLGFALVLTSRRRPMLNLFVFWLGGKTAGVGLAMATLLLLRDFADVVVRNAMSVIDHVRAHVVIFTGGRLQITFGVLLLLALVIIKVRERAREETLVTVGGGQSEAVSEPPAPTGLLAWFAARTHDMLKSDMIWPVFVAGAASAIPPVDGVAMLAVIMASRADLGTQFTAFIVFTVLMLSIIELPLVSYVVWPQKTAALVQLVQTWIHAHFRRIIEVLLGMAGITALVQGVASL